MEKNKTIKRLSAVLFAVLLIAALVLSVLTKGFTDWRFGKEQPAVNDLNNNVVVTPQEGNGGIRLMAEFQPEITESGDTQKQHELTAKKGSVNFIVPIAAYAAYYFISIIISLIL